MYAHVYLIQYMTMRYQEPCVQINEYRLSAKPLHGQKMRYRIQQTEGKTSSRSRKYVYERVQLTKPIKMLYTNEQYSMYMCIPTHTHICIIIVFLFLFVISNGQLESRFQHWHRNSRHFSFLSVFLFFVFFPFHKSIFSFYLISL